MSNLLFSLSDVYNTEKQKYPTGIDADILTGNIISNRIVGIAYDRLETASIPKEIRKAFEHLVSCNRLETDLFFKKLKFMCKILSEASFPYALLKGAFLTSKLYKRGYRTSNDIDILIEPCNVSALQKLLLKNGFVQGSFSVTKEIVPASRKEIITAKLNYGETVPWVTNLHGIPIEIDINFSIDYKPEQDEKNVAALLSKVQRVEYQDHEFYSLCPEDFFIHLCCHLYKEATTYEWVKWRRDLQLYKFSDINVFLSEYANRSFINNLMHRINTLHLQQECYYTIANATIIYPRLLMNSNVAELLKRIKPDNLSFMKQIINPKENTVYYHSMEFEEWFCCNNRLIALRKM